MVIRYLFFSRYYLLQMALFSNIWPALFFKDAICNNILCLLRKDKTLKNKVGFCVRKKEKQIGFKIACSSRTSKPFSARGLGATICNSFSTPNEEEILALNLETSSISTKNWGENIKVEQRQARGGTEPGSARLGSLV